MHILQLYNDPNITLEVLNVFVAVVFLSWYNTTPSKRHYCDAALNARNDLVYYTMRLTDLYELVGLFIAVITPLWINHIRCGKYALLWAWQKKDSADISEKSSA